MNKTNKGLIIQTREGAKKALDQIRETIFDTETYGAAATMNGNKSFFSNIQGKGIIETNLTQANFLEKDVSYKVISLKLKADVGFADRSVLPELIRNSAIDFRISDRSFYKGNARFAAGGIQTTVEIGAAAVDYGYLQLGSTSEHGVFFGKEFYHAIPSQYSFSVEMPTANTALQPSVDLKLQCVLDGLRRRPML